MIGNERSYVVYFVNRLYDYENPDEGEETMECPSDSDER